MADQKSPASGAGKYQTSWRDKAGARIIVQKERTAAERKPVHSDEKVQIKQLNNLYESIHALFHFCKQSGHEQLRVFLLIDLPGMDAD